MWSVLISMLLTIFKSKKSCAFCDLLELLMPKKMILIIINVKESISIITVRYKFERLLTFFGYKSITCKSLK